MGYRSAGLRLDGASGQEGEMRIVGLRSEEKGERLKAVRPAQS